MAKVCISGYYGYKNFGDEAILSVLLDYLSEHEVTVFSGDPFYTSQKYNVRSVKNFDLKNIIKSIKNSDILISGGGSLLQDVTSFKSLVYYSLIIALGVLFKKKVIIFAQGIGPINNKIGQLIVKNLLKNCSITTVRDQKSFQLLNDWGIDSYLVCDPIYSLKIESSKSTSSVGIQLRDFKTMNYNLLQKLAQLVIAKFSDKQIELFSLQEAQDFELCKKFEQILHEMDSNINTEIVTDDIVERISKLEYLIGMRFHALLVALKSGVKCCAINYDVKVEKLANEANIPIISMDANENFELIFQQLQNLNKDELLRFANSKFFDWDLFSRYL